MSSPFFIVCSASSGSTLLSILLDNHPEIAIGPELSIFNKRLSFESISILKRNFENAIKSGTPTYGQVEFNGYFTNLESYYWTVPELKRLLSESSTNKHFFDSFFNKYLNERNKSIFGEKTGSNAYYLNDLLRIYPDAKIIHLIRSPEDSINSIIKRTLNETNLSLTQSIYHAVSHWLYNNAASYVYRYHSSYFQLKYEDLVTDPKSVLKSILNFLGVKNIDLLSINI
jgi:hypothetical protein